MIGVKCEICGKSFSRKTGGRFCSRDCHNKSGRKEITCPWCKKEFTVRKSSKAIFDSYSCKGFYYSSLKNGIVQIKSEKKNIQWSDNIAYLIGLIASDGTLRKYRKCIRIASKDMQQLENVQQIVCDEITGRKNKIIPEHKKVGDKVFITNSYQFTSKVFYEFCENIGIMPNKSLILGNIDIPEKHFSHFLRGIIDGDGNYNILRREYKTYKVNHIHIRVISGSFLFVDWLNEECTRIFNIQKGTIVKEIRKAPNHNKYTLFWSNKRAVTTLLEKIYSGDSYFLERKKNTIDSALLENKEFDNLRRMQY